MKKIIVIGILSIVYGKGWGQHTYDFGMLPAININKKISSDWRLNLKAESRITITELEFKGPLRYRFNYNVTDVSAIVSKKTTLNTRLAAGYLFRLTRDEVNHRFIQQFTIVKRYALFRLAHRIAADQSLRKEMPLTFRLRYRMTVDIAIKGQSVNNRELYFKCNHEYLGLLRGNDTDLEIRLAPLLGYALRDDNKIEWGVDYRIGSFLEGASRNRFWFVIHWFLSL